jgi:hypothetical protein
VKNNCLKTLKKLLKKNVETNIPLIFSKNSLLALKTKVSPQLSKEIDLWMKKQIPDPFFKFTPEIIARMYGHTEVIFLLKTHEKSTKIGEDTPLLFFKTKQKEDHQSQGVDVSQLKLS